MEKWKSLKQQRIDKQKAEQVCMTYKNEKVGKALHEQFLHTKRFNPANK